MKKPSIPSASALPPQLAQIIGPIKENIEIITGARGGPLLKLDSAASTKQVIDAVNAIMDRLNSAG